MQYFPNLKQGDPINRRWFNDLIGFCNSLVLRGDGRTTRVNRTASGTTVSAIPQPVAAGGGGGSSLPTTGDDFIVTKTGALTLHISRGRVVLPSGVLTPFLQSGTTITMPSGAGDYYLVVAYSPISVVPGIIGNVYISAVYGLTMPFDYVHQATIAKVTISGGSVSGIQQIKGDPIVDRFEEFAGQVVPYYSSGLPYGAGIAPPAVIVAGDGSPFYATQVKVHNGNAVNPNNTGRFYDYNGDITVAAGKDRIFAWQASAEAPTVEAVNDPSDLSGKYGCYIADIAILGGKCSKIYQKNYGTAVFIEI